MTAIEDYYQALKRLSDNRPINVQKGTRVNNDTVALEAGRKRGSIKRSRPRFSKLIEDIERAANNQNRALSNLERKVASKSSEALNYKEQYHKALNRELMLINKIHSLEKKLRAAGIE